MIVIYHDIGGSHSSIVAANIHINNLPGDTIPDKDSIQRLPGFDGMKSQDWGRLIYAGDDEFGTKVFIISRQNHPELVVPAIKDMYRILNGDDKGLYVINTTPTTNVWMAIGGYSSRMLGLVRFGRPIVTYGTLKSYTKIAKLVGEVKERIRRDMVL